MSEKLIDKAFELGDAVRELKESINQLLSQYHNLLDKKHGVSRDVNVEQQLDQVRKALNDSSGVIEKITATDRMENGPEKIQAYKDIVSILKGEIDALQN